MAPNETIKTIRELNTRIKAARETIAREREALKTMIE